MERKEGFDNFIKTIFLCLLIVIAWFVGCFW